MVVTYLSKKKFSWICTCITRLVFTSCKKIGFMYIDPFSKVTTEVYVKKFLQTKLFNFIQSICHPILY